MKDRSIVVYGPFVLWDAHFSPFQPLQPDRDGLVWLYDAEGCPLLKCHPSLCRIVAAALEYAQADVEAIYGVGYGNLTDDQAAQLLEHHAGEHPHVDGVEFAR